MNDGDGNLSQRMMTMKNLLQRSRKTIKIKNMLFLTIAGIINAFGITIFLNPVNLYDSGISGTAMLAAQLTPESLSLSLFLIIFNLPLFLFGLKKQGKKFTFYAIYTVAVYSFISWLITDVLPVDVSMASPLAGTDLLLCAVFGGVISGIGSGLAIKFGGAMDGIEVMAVIFAKKIGVSVGSFVMAYNIVLYVVCGFILQSWILPLYSIVTYFAALKTIDFIVEGFDRAKAATIIASVSRCDEICNALSEEFQSGVTVMQAQGGYSGKDKVMIYFVVNRFQIGKLKEIVREIDKKAYISITEVADVFSRNDSL